MRVSQSYSEEEAEALHEIMLACVKAAQSGTDFPISSRIMNALLKKSSKMQNKARGITPKIPRRRHSLKSSIGI